MALLPASAVLLILRAPRGGIEVVPGAQQTGPPRAVHRAVFASLRDAMAIRALRSVVFMDMILGACQLGIAAYFVVYRWHETELQSRAGNAQR
jgi:hypothetical protein